MNVIYTSELGMVVSVGLVTSTSHVTRPFFWPLACIYFVRLSLVQHSFRRLSMYSELFEITAVSVTGVIFVENIPRSLVEIGSMFRIILRKMETCNFL